MSRSQTSFRTRRSCLAEMRRFRSSAGRAAGGCRGDDAEAQDGARRAYDPVEANCGDLVAIAIDLVVDVPLEPPLVSSDTGSLFTNRSVSRMAPSLKLRARSIEVAVPWVISTLPPPMSITTARPLPTSTP